AGARGCAWVRGRGWSRSWSHKGSPNLFSGIPTRRACVQRVPLSSAPRTIHSIVLLHACWLIGLWEFGHDRPIVWPWFAVFVLLQVGRLWVIASLGRRWTTRVLVLRGAAPIARGPYRWIRHPNYLIVALEIAVVPLALGMPVFALIFSVANAALLVYRIRIENEALVWAAGAA